MIYSIVPPKDLVAKWSKESVRLIRFEAKFISRQNPKSLEYELYIAQKAAAWGASQSSKLMAERFFS